jgi:hypothetical protein
MEYNGTECRLEQIGAEWRADWSRLEQNGEQNGAERRRMEKRTSRFVQSMEQSEAE